MSEQTRPVTEGRSASEASPQIFRSLQAAHKAGVRLVVQIETRKFDDGSPLTGVRFMDLWAFKHSSDATVRSLRESIANSRKDPLESRPRATDLSCKKRLDVIWRDGRANVTALQNERHDCGVVGLGAHAKGVVFAGDGSSEPLVPDEASIAVLTPAVDPSPTARYFPALSVVDGVTCYSVGLRLERADSEVVDEARRDYEGPRGPGSTHYYMSVERFVVHLLSQAGLLRIGPFEHRDMNLIRSRLQECLRRSRVNGDEAIDRVYVTAPGDTVAGWEAFKAALAISAQGTPVTVIVVGEIVGLDGNPVAREWSISMAGMPDKLHGHSAEESCTNDPSRLAGWSEERVRSEFGPLRMLGIAVISVGADGSERLGRLGGLLMSDALMWAESYGEGRDSNNMYKAGVDHEKCIAPVSVYGFTPDYLIHGYPYPVLHERWGMLSDEYREHMQRKVSAARGVLPLVQSDVAHDPHGLPVFPEAIEEAIRDHERLLGLGDLGEIDSTESTDIQPEPSKAEPLSIILEQVKPVTQEELPVWSPDRTDVGSSSTKHESVLGFVSRYLRRIWDVIAAR